jgi:hypothetical protein
VRRVLDDQVAIYTWLAIIAAGVAVMLLTGRPVWFEVGFAAGGVVAFALVAVKARRDE